jgi:hypothetical protein
MLTGHWQNPSGALVCSSSQQAISTGPSNINMWGSGQQCLSIPGAVQTAGYSDVPFLQ